MKALGFLALGLAATLFGLERPRELSALASPSAVLRGSFEQVKILKGFTRPLRSRGRFTVLRDKGVLWRIEKPFASGVCVDGRGLWQVVEGPGGLRRTALQRGDMGPVLGLLQTLLTGERAALVQAFELVEKEAPAGTWRLELIPRDAVLRRVISRVELQGAERVQRVAWDESNGDRSVIRFGNFQESAMPTPDEAGAFGD